MGRRQPAILFIFITLFLDVLGIGLIIPIWPKLVEQLLNGDTVMASRSIGWLSTLFALMQFVFAPILGSLSDRFGRRPVILTSLFGSGIDYLLLAWAPSIAWLFVGRVISGITASNFSAANAYIADVTPPEKRAAGFGIMGAAFGLGFVAGPALGGYLASYGPRTPFLVAAGITLANWIYGAFVLPESLPKENRKAFTLKSAHPIKAIQSLRRWPVVVGLAVTQFLSYLAGNIYQVIWVLYTHERYGWEPKQVGKSLALVGIMAAIVQAGLAGRVVKAIGETKSAYLGLLAMMVAMACYATATQGWMIYAIIPIGSLAGIGAAAIQAMISKCVPETEQGTVQGSLSSIMSIAGIVGPLIWAGLFAKGIAPDSPIHLPGLPFFGASLVALIAVFTTWFAFRRAAATPASDA